MQRLSKIAIAVLLIAIFLVVWLSRAHNPQRVESSELHKSLIVLAALGRVEGRDKTISLGASADGVVKEVRVKEGQKVDKGTILSVLDCDDILASIDQAKAQAESARQTRIRLLRGHREEEREAAARATDAAKAMLAQAEEHFGHINDLYQMSEGRDPSRDVFQQAKNDLGVARANYEKTIDEQRLADAKPLPEEVSRADADVVAAEQNVNVATDKFEKCQVRAPISGTILTVMTKTGESYSTLLPHPLFMIADESLRRVRAEVDERDIGKVKLGQISTVTADAFPGRSFEGQVVEISHAMEPNSIFSVDPAQKTDRDVLDVMIELKHPGEELPVGLRVTAQIASATLPLPPPSIGPPTDSSTGPVSFPTRTVPSSTLALRQNPTGVALQVAAMTVRENADALAATLIKKGFTAFVLTRENDQFYRVDVGPYPDAGSASPVRDQLKDSGFAPVIEQQLNASGRESTLRIEP